MDDGNIVTYLGLAGLTLHFLAQAIVIFTPTPDPATKIGKIYRLIEVAAGLVGQAKDEFSPKNPPSS